MVQLFIGALFTAVVAVLLVIAANVGNLVAARTAARRGELAVRAALGAGRHQLVLQLFGEVLLLGGIAALLGGAALHELMARVSLWLGSELPFWVDFMPGPATWTFLTVVTVVASAVAGGVPALRATRSAPAEALSAAGRGGTGGVFGRSAPVTTVLQVAMSVALLGAALLAVRGMSLYAGRLDSVPEDHILTAGMSLGGPGGADSADVTYRRIEAAVSVLPGVEHAGFATQVPRVEAPTVPVSVDAAPGEPPAEPHIAPVVGARPGFLAALGARPVLGRFLQREDFLPGAPEVAVVNESFVRKFLHGRYPLGRRVRFVPRTRVGGDDAAPPPWREIVGVVPDLGLSVGDPELEAGVYVPLRDPSWVYLAVSVSGSPATLADPLRRALARVDPELLVSRVQTLDHVASENATALALFGALLGALGGMALLLSVVSTYALVSFTVSRRLREVGIRVALGASRGAVLRSVAGRAAFHVALGAALGAPLGLLLVQTRRLFVFRVPAGEWWILPSVAMAMLAAGVLASWYPAQRALGVEASEALKAE
jgi:predicted permease